jgi:hypothetical protein
MPGSREVAFEVQWPMREVEEPRAQPKAEKVGLGGVEKKVEAGRDKEWQRSGTTMYKFFPSIKYVAMGVGMKKILQSPRTGQDLKNDIVLCRRNTELAMSD